MNELAKSVGRELTACGDLVMGDSADAGGSPVVIYYLRSDGTCWAAIYDPCDAKGGHDGTTNYIDGITLEDLIQATKVYIQGIKGCGHLWNAWSVATEQARATMYKIECLKQ